MQCFCLLLIENVFVYSEIISQWNHFHINSILLCHTKGAFGSPRMLFVLLISSLLCCCPSDTFIQKTKQRYNNPRSLSTKINLADMQTEIKLRPPYQLSPEDLRAINGFSVHAPSKYKGIGRTRAAHVCMQSMREACNEFTYVQHLKMHLFTCINIYTGCACTLNLDI